jgi:hypothetical protein
MNGCPLEPQMLHAAQRDEWTPQLREHLTQCDECVAAVSVAPWMHRFSRMDEREHRLPDASIVYLKAKLLQRTADVTRVSRPMDIAQMLAYVIVAGGWAWLLTWKWSAVELWLRSLTPGSVLLEAGARTETLTASFFGIVVVLASVTVMVALHTIMAEE